MAAFDYVAVDPRGRTLKGVVSAPSPDAAEAVGLIRAAQP